MSFLGTLARGVAGFVAGGPAGAAAAVLAGGPKKPAGGAITIPYNPIPLQVPDSTKTTRAVSLLPPGYTSTTTSYYGGGDQITNPGALGTFACPTGFKMNKSRYVTRGGGTSRWPVGLQLHEKGSVCVRRRSINPGNGKAATRAVRRLVAFYRLSNRVAKQLRRAAAGAKLGRGGRRGTRMLPRGNAVTVVDTD